MELEKDPVPVPSSVLLSEIVGVCEVLQQTPRWVTLDPPSLVILPPEKAEVAVTKQAMEVDNSAKQGHTSTLPQYSLNACVEPTAKLSGRVD